jgi:type IV secretory pathway VirB2 component (pilin)
MKFNVSVVVAISTGLITLVAYFIPLAPLQAVRGALLQSGAILATVALMLGAGNLLSVHARKIRDRKPGHLYSIFLVISLLSVFIVVTIFGTQHPYSVWIVTQVQQPLEVALTGLLAGVLVIAGVRVMFRRPHWSTYLFFVTAVIVLLGTAPLPFVAIPVLQGFRNWLAQVPAVGGGRGLLLGIALGAATTGLRVLMGFDQPYQR